MADIRDVKSNTLYTNTTPKVETPPTKPDDSGRVTYWNGTVERVRIVMTVAEAEKHLALIKESVARRKRTYGDGQYGDGF